MLRLKKYKRFLKPLTISLGIFAIFLVGVLTGIKLQDSTDILGKSDVVISSIEKKIIIGKVSSISDNMIFVELDNKEIKRYQITNITEFLDYNSKVLTVEDVKKDDKVIITSEVPLGGTSNAIRIRKVK